jgi:uncharacterized protein YidB (DUF937 family)
MNGLLGQILTGMIAGNLGRRGMRRGGGGNTIVNGLLIALAVKAAHSYFSQRGQGRSFNPTGAAPQGGLPGGLGGILGSLGGAGALGGLLSQLRQRGLGEQVDSWVRPGPNRLVAPHELEQALGEEEVETLVEETGMPKQALLAELSQALPEAVDELTPDGTEPDDATLTRVAGTA